jgi:hypothetical protein
VKEKEAFGKEPPCGSCRRPQWRPANLLAWLIYQACATQFAYDFKVGVFEVMEEFGVRNRARMLGKLNVIHDCARENQERLRR